MSNPLWLGNTTKSGQELFLGHESLLRHFMAIGSSGSGKTVLCKVLTEEILHSKIPVICIDPQGDLCSLAIPELRANVLKEHGLDPAFAEELATMIDPVIYTPASSKGIHLTADPFPVTTYASKEEHIRATSVTASIVTSLLGYDLNSADADGAAAFLNLMIELWKPKCYVDLAKQIHKMDSEAMGEYNSVINTTKIEQLSQRMSRTLIGSKSLMFNDGEPINIGKMLAKSSKDKVRLNIIYLNTLATQEDKDFFVAVLTERLLGWMLQNPSTEMQGLFYIDEVAPFIPPVRKPASKPALQVLFKQARKYGISCMMATQSPGDVDYKAMSQFGTWAIGRLTTKQDINKVVPVIKSLAPKHTDIVLGKLPQQAPGEFIIMSPDNFKTPISIKSRWLHTKHLTLDEDAIAKLKEDNKPHIPTVKLEPIKSIAPTIDTTKISKKPAKEIDWEKKYRALEKIYNVLECALPRAMILVESHLRNSGQPIKEHLKTIQQEMVKAKLEATEAPAIQEPLQTVSADEKAELVAERDKYKARYEFLVESYRKLGIPLPKKTK